MKILVDECLSPSLAEKAQAEGYESTHVTHAGMGGWKDWRLIDEIIDKNWTLVTRNSIDFRGPAAQPGTGGLYAKVELHAGLVCLNAEYLDLDMQQEMFELALDELRKRPDLVNQVLEVTLEGEEYVVRRYALPVEVQKEGVPA